MIVDDTFVLLHNLSYNHVRLPAGDQLSHIIDK